MLISSSKLFRRARAFRMPRCRMHMGMLYTVVQMAVHCGLDDYTRFIQNFGGQTAWKVTTYDTEKEMEE
jgi:hypothetical protein